uniref:Putative triabin n=1 Tax=Panstrongylus megistus TaxID=65343 RepID=A0A069DPM7_9HEMI
MKTIIAVTFIGIMTYALEENSEMTSEITECNKPAMANFDSEKYSKFMPAYTTHARYGSGFTVCRVFESVTTSCDAVDTNIYGYYHDSGVIYHYKMLCNTSEEKYEKGQFLATCAIIEDSYYGGALIIIPFELYMSVVDTDYENYAIFYTCIKDETGVEDNYEVLQKIPNAFDKKVKEVLQSKGMNLENFNARNATYCQKMNKDKKKRITKIYTRIY